MFEHLMRKSYSSAIASAKERLMESVSWFPYPSLFTFGIIIILSGHISLGINPRLGNPSEIMPYDSEPLNEGAIWMSVSIQDDEVVVTTDDRKVITWKSNSKDSHTIKELENHLQERMTQITLSTSLAKEINHIESLVVLSVDQRVKYLHVKPILLALAKVGISEYGFETRLL